ncbi:general transcription factor [Lithospermum erythrorhizon]|uniref:General transcription factor n=1 Tax=Lithospermum erythrorhizon TaxID=34254 RepID=A0AAV3NNN7_LITER
MSRSLDYWRGYFKGVNSDIFDIIEQAIIVAALDCPKDFKSRRDHIAQLLFTCKMTKCFGCNGVGLSVPRKDFYDEEDEGAKCKNGEVGSKESKFNISGVDGDQVEMEMNVNHVCNVSYGDVEALTDEIEEESQFIGEVLRIKEILDNHQEESDSVLNESLRRLQLMDLSVEILKVTEIGKSVNGLKKHGSKQIRDLVRTLIEGWVGMLDAWMNAAAAITENTSPESVKTSAVVEEDEGLPSPPLDEGAFFAHSIELSHIFDGMDDDGSPLNNGGFNKNRVTWRKPSVEDKGMNDKPHNLQKSIARGKDRLTSNQVEDNKSEQPMKEEKMLPGVRPSKSSSVKPGSGRPPKPTIEQKIEKLRMQKTPLVDPQHVSPRNRELQPDKGAMRKKSLAPPQEKLRSPDMLQLKMEATKRKLQERYQEAENAKKQRTVQVMDLSDIPKHDAIQNQQMKHGVYNHNRHWTNGRR